MELEDVISAPETSLVVAADTLEVAAVPPEAVFAPAIGELAAAVAPAEAGQLAADGNFMLTLCRLVVSNLRVSSFLGAE